MKKLQEHDWLEDLLRQPQQQIPDDGFSQKVLHALPNKNQGHNIRLVVILSLTFVACLIGFFAFPVADFLIESIKISRTWNIR